MLLAPLAVAACDDQGEQAKAETDVARNRDIERVAQAPRTCLASPSPRCLTDLGLSMVDDPAAEPLDRYFALIRAAEALGVMGATADYDALFDRLSAMAGDFEDEDADYAEELLVEVLAAGGRTEDREDLMAALDEAGRWYDGAAIAKYLAVGGERASQVAVVEDVLALVEEEAFNEESPYVFTAIDLLELCRSRPFLDSTVFPPETWKAVSAVTGLIPRLLAQVERGTEQGGFDEAYGGVYYRLATVQCAAADGIAADRTQPLLRETRSFFQANTAALDDIDRVTFLEDSIVTQWTLGDRDGALAQTDLTFPSIDTAIILFRLATYMALEGKERTSL
ncbi:hypothetical protein [Rhodospirillum sp. A1_3_36]|uniref:hypothetical protein n=1 Tax=Rhodospirillum sp. A1_3_36 TaxID=3391666 RepID=UPI0039A5FAE3